MGEKKGQEQDSRGQVENLLSELGKKIDILFSEAKDAKDDFRDEFEKQVHDLKDKKEKLQKEFEEFKSQDKWDQAKQHFVGGVNELKKAIETVFKK